MKTFDELIQQSRVQDKEADVKVKGKCVIIPVGDISRLIAKQMWV